MVLLILLLLILVVGTFGGWVAHRLGHSKWRCLSKLHKQHHRLYPPRRLLTEAYTTHKGWDTSVLAIPIVALLVGGLLLGALSLGLISVWECVGLALVSSLIGFAHEWLHREFHKSEAATEPTQAPKMIPVFLLRRTVWFKRLQVFHLQHHRQPDRNFGLLTTLWDKVFKSGSKKP